MDKFTLFGRTEEAVDDEGDFWLWVVSEAG